MLSIERLVTVGYFPNAFEAHLAAGHLENYGIPAVVAEDSTALNRLGYLRPGGIRVRVRVQDADEARRVLSEVDELDEEYLVDDGEADEEPGQADDPPVCPLCASPELQARPRVWVIPVILLPLLLWPVKPVAAIAFTVALWAGSRLLPRKYFCGKCRNVVTPRRRRER